MRIIMQKTLDIMILSGMEVEAKSILDDSYGQYYIGEIGFFIYKEDEE